MKNKTYNNRKLIGKIGIITTIIGLISAYFYWGVEPQETISGFICGIGVSATIFLFL